MLFRSVRYGIIMIYMRKIKIVPGEHYHIYNRGNNKQNIFLDERDWARFLFLTLYFQSPATLNNIGNTVSKFIKHRVFNISGKTAGKIISNRMVELAAFTQMPNHFHFIVKETKEGEFRLICKKYKKIGRASCRERV